MVRHGYPVIIAGGKGTRFWPLSRARRPKQLLRIVGSKSLIRETVERVLPLFGRANTLVVTIAEHHRALRKELRMLPAENFIIEPQGNNTAPCIGLAAAELARRDPEALMVVLPADHSLSGPKTFRQTVKRALRLAREHDALVTIGIPPAYPETGYGYIVKGKKIKGAAAGAYRVKGFKEKPSLAEARRLIRRGSLWNSGIFVWKAATILEMLRRFAPSIHSGIRSIEQASRLSGLGNPSAELRRVLRGQYRKMPAISIDYAVLERAGAAGRVLTVKGNFAWSDVGNWAAVHRMLARDRNGNAGKGKWLGVDSRDCLVYSQDRLVALLGMRGTVVVDTPDALLVADMARAQEVKELVDELERKGYGGYAVK